jgi:hypothetical protein
LNERDSEQIFPWSPDCSNREQEYQANPPEMLVKHLENRDSYAKHDQKSFIIFIIFSGIEGVLLSAVSVSNRNMFMRPFA